MKQTDILIAGGGIAGLALAKLLADIGLRIDLIEPSPPKSMSKTPLTGRTVALMESSINIIKATAVWDSVAEYATSMEAMRIIDDSQKGQPHIDTEFSAQDIGMKQFGYNIPNAFLRAVLYEHVKKMENVKIHKARFADMNATPSYRIVTLDDETKIKATLVVGADGRSSAVREKSGIKVKRKKYNQTAVTCVINHSRAHQNMATEFHRPSGPFALVPMIGNQSSVVWVETPARADALLKLKKQDFEQTLQDNTNNVLGGITLEVGPEAWPLCTIKAQSLIADRVALVAEAAHVMSPITAQGLNLSLRDVAALAEVVTDALRLGLDFGSGNTLCKYQKRRQIDVKTRVFGVDSMNRIVSNDISFVKGIRRIGLKATDKVAPLKHFAMKHGLAPQLDLGRLAQGKSL